LKAVLPQADPHNYDEETHEFHPHEVVIPTPHVEKV
jgi:molybdopterin-containing oxidoreductase family membrane subunit